MDELIVTLYHATSTSDYQSVVSAFGVQVSEANLSLNEAKNLLEILETSNTESGNQNGDHTSEVAFRRCACLGHAKRLRGILTRISTCQTMFESEISRRSSLNQTDSPTVPERSDQSQIAQAFAKVTEQDRRMKANDMKRLEKSLAEIREAFVRIAALVEYQGEMVDCIEFSVVNAKNYSHDANIQLIKARRKQRQRSLLWAFCGLFLLTLLVFGILGILEALGIKIFRGCNRRTESASGETKAGQETPLTLVALTILGILFVL